MHKPYPHTHVDDYNPTDELILLVAELYNDAKKSKVVKSKELVDRAVAATQTLFFKHGLGNSEKPASLNNTIFMDFMRTFKPTKDGSGYGKKFTLTAELVFRELKQVLYTEDKIASRIVDFSKYLQADKNFKKEYKKEDSKSELFTINKAGYDNSTFEYEILRLLQVLTIRGYITMLLVLATLREEAPAINYTVTH